MSEDTDSDSELEDAFEEDLDELDDNHSPLDEQNGSETTATKTKNKDHELY